MFTKGNGQFPTTQWALIERLSAGDTKDARLALDELCAQYHYPLYCYIRSRGLEHYDAEDALHDFLVRQLRLDSLKRASEGRGRLRHFLTVSLKRFLITRHQAKATRMQERCLSLEALQGAMDKAEQRYLKERFTDGHTPEHVFDRQWAHELLARVLRRLGEHYASRGREALFKALRPSLLAGGSLRGQPVEAMAESLGTTAGALRTAQLRLLAKYREFVEAEVAQTVSDPADVRGEIEYLMSLFASPE